jgi:hypothetical protein
LHPAITGLADNLELINQSETVDFFAATGDDVRYDDCALETFQSCLGSSFKCNTQRPQGIGCCDGQTKQAPQQRGTWRDFGGA